jgi:threo-3-hydroxy-L-aspartate ammonia-lyase
MAAGFTDRLSFDLPQSILPVVSSQSTLRVDDVRAARERIASHVHTTPLVPSRSLSERIGVEVRLKCENLQRSGSFKIRGATNALRQLSPETRAKGVVAFSSGNHAQGVALAAHALGIPATVVMPEDSVRSKVEATKAYGARVVQEGVTPSNRGQVAARIAAESGATIIPPFHHPHIIAGAGTVGLEIVEEWPDVTTIVVPLGGGGLLAGVSLAATSVKPGIDVYGVEPEAGNDGQRSLRAGEIQSIDPPDTIADGARTTALGELNFTIIRECVRDVATVDDDALRAATLWAMYRTKLVIEPTGALGLAALLEGRIRPRGPVAVVISGGNVHWPALFPGGGAT